jgi:hypothetical protein
MHELLAGLFAVETTHKLARSALPDAPVVPDKHRRARKIRLSIAGVPVRRTRKSTSREAQCAT